MVLSPNTSQDKADVSIDNMDKSELEESIKVFLTEEFDKKYNSQKIAKNEDVQTEGDVTDSSTKKDKFDAIKLIKALAVQLESSADYNQPLLKVVVDSLALASKELNQAAYEELVKPATSIMYSICEKCEELQVGVLISYLNFLCHLLEAMHMADFIVKSNFTEWITPWTSLFRYSLRLLDKNLSTITDPKNNNLHLASLCLVIFQHIVILSENNQSWFYTVRRHLILESMISLLCNTIELKRGFGLAQSLLTSLILISTIPGLSDSLQTIKAVEQINEALQTSKDTPSDDQKNPFMWIKIFELTLKLATSLLVTLRHQYASTTIDLLVKHSDEITNCFTNLRDSPTMALIEEATYATSLLCNLTSYKHVWMSHDKSSYETFVLELSKTCNSLIAFALRPGLLQHLINHPHHLPNVSQNSTTPVSSTTSSSTKPTRVTDIETSRISRLTPLDGEHINLDLHQALFKLLSQMLLFLHNVHPNLLEVLTMVNFGIGMKSSKIDYRIGAPSIDPNKTMSLGSFLSCISLCIRMYTKKVRISFIFVEIILIQL